MTAELGLADAQLDRLFAQARSAEASSQLDEALAALTVAVAELTARGETYRYLFEWMAQLESALGHHTAADEMASVARELGVEAGSTVHVFRMDVLRARIARERLELDQAEALLAELRIGEAALGAPIAARLEAVLGWVRDMVFPDASPRDLAIARCEVALAIVELWAERGRYRSALSLLDAISPDLPAARSAVRADQVQLLRAELQLAAGSFADAHLTLDSLAPQATAVDRSRKALVRVRAALAGGQLARADQELGTLAATPVGDPMLFASANAARVAVEAELNQRDAAIRIAMEAKVALVARGGPCDAVDLIERARLEAAARGRVAFTRWELPYVSGTGAPAMPPPPAHEPAGMRWRFTTAWTAAANGVLFALERGDPSGAAAEQARLEKLIRGIESEYVATCVALSGAMVAYYDGRGDAGRFLAIADRFAALGARTAEAQAVRYAGWAAARLRRYDDHAVLARRASAIVDAIAAELGVGRRASFMRNKWSGRDELVEHLLRTTLRKTTLAQRDLCRTFRDIDLLTHQPIDEALGATDAMLAGDATDREVQAWLDGDAARARARTSRTSGIAIRSPWSLWRIPARTLILHYHVLPDRTFLFRIARRHIDVEILPYGRLHLALDMRAALDDDEQLRCLASSIGVADAIARFPGVDRLVIVPHDAVASVPFAALPIGDRRLCEVAPIVQIDRIARLRRRAWRWRSGRLLAIGRKHYRDGDLPDLESAEEEARSVVEISGGADPPLLDATRERVLAGLPGSQRLHVAAHGVFDAMQPARSGIVLGREGGGYDTLTLRELRNVDLRALRLATLATCRSAEHAQLPGRERVCLPTALLDAGARGVIASLWPVEDEPSVDVMRALYAELRANRPAVALARMQAALVRQPTKRIPMRCWAGLVFYGNE